MKKTTILVLLLCCLYECARATHAAAGELIYSLVPGENHQYKFTLKFFRDCTGNGAPQSQILCYTNQCGAVTQSVVMNLEVPLGAVLPNGHIQGAAVPSGCAGANNTCNGGNLPGFQEYWYSVNLTLPAQCNSWHFWVYNCCRNGSIGNIDNPASEYFFVETTYDNTNNQNFNTSPTFSQLLLPYVCVNIPVTYNNGAYDLNGDSLTYELIEPRSLNGCGAYTPIDILSPLYNTVNNPLPTNNTFSIDPGTGLTTFTPVVTGTYVLSVKVREYRNGNLIGHIIRDLQFVVGNCTLVQPVFSLDTAGITGGYISNNQINTCVGDTLNACFQLSSANAFAALYTNDNAFQAIPGGSVTYNGTGTNAVTGCVSWAPAAANAGLHMLIVKTIDSSCVAQGQLAGRTDTIPIYVNNLNVSPTINITASTNAALTGTPLTFTALTNAGPLYTLDWYRNNILSYTSANSFWNTTMQAGNNTVYAVIQNVSSCFTPDSAVSNAVVVQNISTGVEDIHEVGLKIFPNPADALLNIERLIDGDILKVYNVMGEIIYTQKVIEPGKEIPIAHWPTGIYTLIVIRNNKYIHQHFEKR